MTCSSVIPAKAGIHATLPHGGGNCRAVPFGRDAQDKKKRTHAVR